MTKSESNLPNPNIVGPCNLQASPLCDNQGRQRMDPMDMLSNDTAFRGYVSACTYCYDARADAYVAQAHVKYGKGCTCPCLGAGTPEHSPGAICLPNWRK